jgi:myo-inositol-1-phosphate synthase
LQVGDTKRAMDEYYSELGMGGRNAMFITNECEDSLLATPLIFDLAILAELMTRVSYREVPADGEVGEFQPLYSVLSLLSFMLKAPLVKKVSRAVLDLNCRLLTSSLAAIGHRGCQLPEQAEERT